MKVRRVEGGKILWGNPTLLVVFFLAFSICTVCPRSASSQDIDQSTPQLPARPIDDRIGFKILVWQYRNDAIKDADLYRKANLHGFHIDYGEGKVSRAAWAKQQDWPYYVDHAAGKGILHLTQRSGLDKIPRNGEPAARPWSFFDDSTRQELFKRLSRNVPPIASGPALAIALDDEVSLGHFNSPLEVDYSSSAIQSFQKWLPSQYDDQKVLRESWGIKSSESAMPVPYEKIRGQLTSQPPAKWRMASWIDFRSFLDESQANLFANLVNRTNELAPNIPVGVVGAQQPSAYGGFDYSRLRDSLQWTEAYDIGGTNEILHSFWSKAPRRSRMQTYFLSGNLSQDKWFLWYYLSHGNRAVIAWPSIKGKPWFQDGKIHPHVQKLAQTFADVQKSELNVLAHPNTEPIFSPIAILYSHPSVQVGWAIDASAHGKTWPRRSSSLDNSCLSSGKNRVAWTRLLEDLGHQARFVDTADLRSGKLSEFGCKVLVLPQAFALSRTDCAAIANFARNGGLVIADYGTAITDQHGTGYTKSPLDPLFGIDRSEDKGWFDGKRRYEINGEAYQSPFVQRFAQNGTLEDNGFSLVERTIGRATVSKRHGIGNAIFLNTSPTRYFDAASRSGGFGAKWRNLLSQCLSAHTVKPNVRLTRKDGKDFGVELLRYKSKDMREIWAITTNPTRQASVDNAGSGLKISNQTIELTIKSNRPIDKLRDLRTGETVGTTLRLPTDEALIIEVDYK